MKGNNGKGNIPERDLWETKQELFDLLNKQYKFTFDCCANKKNTKCVNYSEDFIIDSDFICEDDMCWMNPPFSKAYQMFEHFFKIVRKGVAIYRCDNMETKVWQDIILPNASWIFILRGRLNYEGQKGNGARFPSAIIGFNVPIFRGIKGVFLKKRIKIR